MSAPERAAPMYCPYCGEERLRPNGNDPDGATSAGRADWRCEDCLRVFTLRFRGSVAPPLQTRS